MRNWSIGRARLSGLKMVVLAFLLATAAEARASVQATPAAALTHAGRGGSIRLAKAKKKKRRHRAAPAATKSKAGSSSGVDADDEELNGPVETPAKPAAASSKTDDEGETPSQKAAPAEDAEERPAPKKSKRAPAAENASTAESSDQPAATAEKKAEEAPASAAPTPSALQVGLAPMALFRRLSFTSDAAAAGRGGYSLSPGAEAGLWLEVYPAAFSTTGFAADIGVFAHYAHGFGTTSSTPGNGSAATAYQDFLGGVKLRFPLGMLTPNVNLGYGQQSFQLNGTTTAVIPAMSYGFIRVGGGTRIQFTDVVSADAGIGVLSVSGAGSAITAAAQWPQTKVFGVDLGASMAVRLASAVSLRAGVDFRQYSLAFHPGTGSPQVTGAVDRYTVAFVGLEVSLDGLATGPSETAVEPAGESSSAKPEGEGSDEDKKKESKDEKNSSDGPAKPAKSADSDDDEEN